MYSSPSTSMVTRMLCWLIGSGLVNKKTPQATHAHCAVVGAIARVPGAVGPGGARSRNQRTERQRVACGPGKVGGCCDRAKNHAYRPSPGCSLTTKSRDCIHSLNLRTRACCCARRRHAMGLMGFMAGLLLCGTQRLTIRRCGLGTGGCGLHSAAQYAPLHIGAQLFAAHACGGFDGWAVFGWDAARTRPPEVDGLHGNADGCRKLRHTSD
jgi:hypothetical protein